MSQALTPARIISPGRILQRELDARGWTEEDLAQMIAYSSHVIRAIINGYQSITPETAQQLAAGLGISAPGLKPWAKRITDPGLKPWAKRITNPGLKPGVGRVAPLIPDLSALYSFSPGVSPG